MALKNPRIVEALAPLKKQLEEEKYELEQQLAPLREARQNLVDVIQPYELQLQQIDAKITELEVPRLRQIGNELAAIARQEGAITLSNG